MLLNMYVKIGLKADAANSSMIMAKRCMRAFTLSSIALLKIMIGTNQHPGHDCRADPCACLGERWKGQNWSGDQSAPFQRDGGLRPASL